MTQNLLAGWCLMALGVLIGMTIGLWAHDDDWADGYPSYRRRMLRLSHIAAFALGIVLEGEGPQIEIFLDGHALEDPAPFGNLDQSLVNGAMGRLPGDVLTHEFNRAGRGPDQAGDRPQDLTCRD